MNYPSKSRSSCRRARQRVRSTSAISSSLSERSTTARSTHLVSTRWTAIAIPTTVHPNIPHNSNRSVPIQKSRKIFLHLIHQSPPLQIPDSSLRHVSLYTCSEKLGWSSQKCELSHLTTIRLIYYTSQTQLPRQPMV